MKELRRGILTEINPGLYTRLLLIWDNFKPLQDEWVMKGHTDSNCQHDRMYKA